MLDKTALKEQIKEAEKEIEQCWVEIRSGFYSCAELAVLRREIEKLTDFVDNHLHLI